MTKQEQFKFGMNKLVRFPAYLLVQSGCQYFGYKLTQNDSGLSFDAEQLNYHAKLDFYSRLCYAEFPGYRDALMFLDVLISHFNQISELRRQQRLEQELKTTDLQRLFNLSSALIDTLLEDEQKPRETRRNPEQRHALMWELYDYLETLILYGGQVDSDASTFYLKNSDDIPRQLIMITGSTHGHPYDATMSPQGLNNLFDLVQALCFYKTVNTHHPYCADVVTENLQKTAMERSCWLNFDTAKLTASLLKIENEQITFKLYDFHGNDALHRLWRLIREVKTCPSTDEVANPDQILKALHDAYQTNWLKHQQPTN